MKITAHVFYNGKYRKGTVHIERDRIIDFNEENINPEYVLTEGFVNAHTHIGDSFIKEVPRTGIKELVGPGGFKQRMLESADDKMILKGMRESIRLMQREDIRAFFDFRESGIKGLNIIKRALNDGMEGVILTRPSGPVYDEKEIEYLLENSSGIGLSSISDYDPDFISKVARKTKEKGRIFSIHASERIREDIDFILDLKPDFLVHMHRATDDDLRKVSRAGIPVVVAPRSALFFGTFVDFSRFIRNDVRIALGTDNAMLAVPSIRMEMNLSYYLGLDPVEALKAGTIAMDRFLRKEKSLLLFRAGPGEIVKNPYLRPVKRLNISDGII
ncbi:MAG: amidohydrolase [Aciduliprofundum sp.]|nr:MAG: amidohydrolase [Aciduliprofundum sp.]